MQAKGQVFSYSRSIISTMERKLEKENCPSQNITVMVVMDQSHEWMLKLVSEGTIGNRALAQSHSVFLQELTGEHGHITAGIWQRLNQVSRLISPEARHIGIWSPRMGRTEKGSTLASQECLPKVCKLNRTRKYQRRDAPNSNLPDLSRVQILEAWKPIEGD